MTILFLLRTAVARGRPSLLFRAGVGLPLAGLAHKERELLSISLAGRPIWFDNRIAIGSAFASPTSAATDSFRLDIRRSLTAESGDIDRNACRCCTGTLDSSHCRCFRPELLSLLVVASKWYG